MGTKYVFGLTALALGVWLTSAEAADAPPEQPPGVEVQTRGPVHEAYAEPVTPRPRPAPVVPKKPPAPVNEVPPDQKPEGANVQWIPGYWAWDDEAADFLWVSGVWRNVPPGHQWVPGYWADAGTGAQWVPGYWAEQGQQEAQFLPGPPPSIDAGPSSPAPGEDSSYVPGCWIWREARYAWRPGFWITYQPNYVWVAACYRWTPSGYIFIEGHWDYMLRHRGLLFAPVLFSGQAYTEASFSYTPSYVINTTALVNALFVRSDYCSYYFGDYFDPSYQGHGYVPWFDYQVGRAAYDPLYSYYHWHFRHNDWDRSLRDLYTRRSKGEAPRPPHTLAQQNTLVQSIRNSKGTDVNNVLRSVAMTVPITSADQSAVKLQKVSAQQHAAERSTVEQLRKAGQDRQRSEHELKGNGTAPTAARTAKLALPRAAVPAKEARQPAPGLKPPPPPPKVPQHEERVAPKHEPEKPMILPDEPRQAPKALQPHPGTKQAAPPEKAETPKAIPKQPAAALPPHPKEAAKQPEPAPHPAPAQPAPKQPELAPHPAPAPQPKAAPPAPHPAPKEKSGKD